MSRVCITMQHWTLVIGKQPKADKYVLPWRNKGMFPEEPPPPWVRHAISEDRLLNRCLEQRFRYALLILA